MQPRDLQVERCHRTLPFMLMFMRTVRHRGLRLLLEDDNEAEGYTDHLNLEDCHGWLPRAST